MILTDVKLFNFRNYRKLEFQPSKKITVFYGKNGSGKTNLLEAVHFCCLGRSQRTHQDRDMMMKSQPYTAAQLKTIRVDGKHDIELKLRSAGGKTVKTAYVFGKKCERISEMIGHASCVLFAPEDMIIIKGGPQERRRFMDMQISQMRYRYLNELSAYTKVLKYRNIMIKDSYIKKIDEKQMEAWEEILTNTCGSVVYQRKWFLEYLNSVASPIYTNISGKDNEKFTLEYTGQFKDCDTPYLTMQKHLRENREIDIRRGSTTFGPHKDDIDFKLNGHSMKEYASQGQIRTAVLSLKLAMIHIIWKEMGDKPILLLDDVFSELDPKRREALLEYVKDVQTFITCTDLSDVANAKADSYIRVENTEEGAILKFDKKTE